MDKEFIMATAKTAEQQILWSINKWEYMSWGIRQKSALEYEGMATLALRVSGAVHKGWVFISLNEGKDCYEVRLLNVARTKVKRTLDYVYCDNLGQVLDGLIERKAEWTDAQYKDKAVRDSARKMGMEVIDVSKKKAEPMVIDGVRYRPATLEEIENRNVDLYMNGERVYVLMVCRSETIETGESKLDYITLTNMKKVQVEDLYVIDNDNNEPNKEDKTMATKNINNQNESANVQTAAQVNNEIESVAVGEVSLSSIMPKMQAEPEEDVTQKSQKSQKEPTAPEKPVNTGRTRIVVAGVPKPGESGDKPKMQAVANGNGNANKPAAPTKPTKPTTNSTNDTNKAETKAARYAVQLLPSKSGGVWPKLYGFRSEKEAKAVAEKMPSSVNAKWDYGVNGEGRETKTRHWYLSAGKRYCDVMQELADALNKGDRVAVANAAAKACGVYAGVVAENKSKNDAEPKPKRAARNGNGNGNDNGNGNGNDNKPAAPAMSNEDRAMFDLFKKFMAGDKEAVAMVNAMKAA